VRLSSLPFPSSPLSFSLSFIPHAAPVPYQEADSLPAFFALALSLLLRSFVGCCVRTSGAQLLVVCCVLLCVMYVMCVMFVMCLI
jgi:hypothetical protein